MPFSGFGGRAYAWGNSHARRFRSSRELRETLWQPSSKRLLLHRVACVVEQIAGNIVALNGKRPRRSKGANTWDLSRLAELRLYGDEFAFNTATGMLHRVSRTAGFILRELKGGRTSRDVVERLQTIYGVNESRAERDIELFFADLSTLGLIQPRSSRPASRDEA
jgi:hypothetical protein